MRLVLLLALVGCETSDDAWAPACPTVTGQSYACGVDWQLPSPAACEVACAVPPTYSSGSCNACRGYGGELVCAQTFEFNGQRGCCVVDDALPGVRFYGCD